MAFRTTASAELVFDYLTATGDALSVEVCRALGLPSGRHFMHDLRRRLAVLHCTRCGTFDGIERDQYRASGMSAAATLKALIDQLADDEFSTADLRQRIHLRSATLSKALRTLERQGFIKPIPSSRQFRYCRLAQSRPDFIKVFMTAHGLPPSTSTSLSLGHLPLLANRALCGLSIEGIVLAEITTSLTARYSGATLSVPPLPALIPLLQAVLNGGGDTRSAIRGLKPVLQVAEAVKRCQARIATEEVTGSPLAAFCLPEVWMSLLDTQGGIGSFVEAGMQALGGELYPKKAHTIAEKAIRETTKAMKTTGIAVAYDEEAKLLTGSNAAAVPLVDGVLRAKLTELARKASLPVRMVSVGELYRRAARELSNLEGAPSPTNSKWR